MSYNYNLLCHVKKKARPLVLNVKGDGYVIHHNVFYEEAKAPLKEAEPQRVNFGDFFVYEQRKKTVILTNEGQFNFDFMWKRLPNKYIQISPEQGTVKKGEKQEFEILYFPYDVNKMKSYKCQL